MNKFRHEIEEQDSAHSSVTCEITQSANGQRTMPSNGQEGHVYGGGDGCLLQLGESREQQTSGWLAFAICHVLALSIPDMHLASAIHIRRGSLAAQKRILTC